jgi:hypothetical protein
VFHLDNRGHVDGVVETHEDHEDGHKHEDLGADHHFGNTKRTSLSRIDKVTSTKGGFNPETRKKSSGGGGAGGGGMD